MPKCDWKRCTLFSISEILFHIFQGIIYMLYFFHIFFVANEKNIWLALACKCRLSELNKLNVLIYQNTYKKVLSKKLIEDTSLSQTIKSIFVVVKLWLTISLLSRAIACSVRLRLNSASGGKQSPLWMNVLSNFQMSFSFCELFEEIILAIMLNNLRRMHIVGNLNRITYYSGNQIINIICKKQWLVLRQTWFPTDINHNIKNIWVIIQENVSPE